MIGSNGLGFIDNDRPRRVTCLDIELQIHLQRAHIGINEHETVGKVRCLSNAAKWVDELTPAFSHHSLTWGISSSEFLFNVSSCCSISPFEPIQLFLSTRVRNPIGLQRWVRIPTILKLSPRRTTLPSAQYTGAVVIPLVTSKTTRTEPCGTPPGLGVLGSSMLLAPEHCIFIRLSNDISSYKSVGSRGGCTQPVNKLEEASLTAESVQVVCRLLNGNVVEVCLRVGVGL